MALKKQIYRSGTNVSVRWYDDATDEDQFVEHFGLTAAGTTPSASFAYSGGGTPQIACGVSENNGQHIGVPIYALTSTYIRFRNVENTITNPNRSLVDHYYCCWVNAGDPTTTSNGEYELTVGSNASGYYAEFTKSEVKDRQVAGRWFSSSASDPNPSLTIGFPINMQSSDCPMFGNAVSTANQPYIFMCNQTAAASAQYCMSYNFTKVAVTTTFIVEWIRNT